MSCFHDGFHSNRTAYDPREGLLRYFWTCDRCGCQLGEARREECRPSFDPGGHDRFLAGDRR